MAGMETSAWMIEEQTTRRSVKAENVEDFISTVLAKIAKGHETALSARSPYLSQR